MSKSILSTITVAAILPAVAVTGNITEVEAVASVVSQGPVSVPPQPQIVTPGEIARFRLSSKTIRQIYKARRLSDTPEGRKIKRLESGTNWKYADGTYFGAWNMSIPIWIGNGGGKFGKTAAKAKRWAQDLIAWRIHSKVGWQPWSTR